MFLGDKYPQTQAYIRDEASEDDADHDEGYHSMDENDDHPIDGSKESELERLRRELLEMKKKMKAAPSGRTPGPGKKLLVRIRSVSPQENEKR